MFRKGFTLLIAAAATALLGVGSANAQVRTASLQNGTFALAQATSENRIALVIGNSAYQANKPLNNPANDAQAVSQLLNTAGFEVVMAFDLSRDVMKQTVEEFAARVSEKGPDTVVLVYYAGHGLQVDGENYLIPVDAKFQSEADLQEQGVKLADIMGALEAAQSKARIVIIDACRNNPFGGASSGLAIVDAPSGSIIAYSTAPGTEAFDGNGRHSPYAAAFMRTVKTPNLPIEQVFKKVRLLVNESTDSKQTPWESSSLTSDFVFFTNVANPAAPAPAVVPARVTVADLAARPVREAYEIVVAEDSVEYYEEFVRLYPADPLCDHIRRHLNRRKQMIAWQDVTHRNSPEAYASFASRFGNIDLGRIARRLQERPRLVNISFPRRGEGRFGDGRFGTGIKIGNIGNRPVINFPGGNRPNNSNINNNGNRPVLNGNTGINGGNLQGRPVNNGNVANVPTGGNGQNGNGGGKVIPFPQNNGKVSNTGINGGNLQGRPVNTGINPNAGKPVLNGNVQQQINQRPQIQQRPQINQRPQVLQQRQQVLQQRQQIQPRQPVIQRQQIQVQRQQFNAGAARAFSAGGGGGGRFAAGGGGGGGRRR